MDESVTTIHVTKPLSPVRIMNLMDEYPNLEEITCAPSVYARTSTKYIGALKELGIKVEKKYKWGAKSKTNGEEKVVLDLAMRGCTAKQIAAKMNIKINRVYYLLRKSSDDVRFGNYTRRYNHDEVKSLSEDGLSAREISERMDIPRRTVYNILKKK